MRVGESAMISCRANLGIPTPTLVWTRRDHQPLSSRCEEKYPGTILITNIQFEDAGEYECRATNVAGEASQTASILVQQPPQIRIIPDQTELTITEGDELKLECLADGLPSPNVYWEEPRQRHADEGLRSYGAPAAPVPASAQGVIHKYNVGRSDEGTYVCHASNAAGEDQKYITILIQQKRGDVGRFSRLLLEFFSCSS